MATSKPPSVPSAPPSGVGLERIRGAHPTEESWRADALAKSRHSRLADSLLHPIEDHDIERSAAICGDVTRKFLRDFAPALILLPATERQRAQALTAFALVLFDFAGQTGLEGERLAQINRWEYSLEEALSGSPAGQPVFVLLDSEENRQPWHRDGLDALFRAARQRVAMTRPRTIETLDRRSRQLGGALVETLLDRPATPPLESFAAALLRVHALQNLGASLRRHQAHLPTEELPEAWHAGDQPDGHSLTELVRKECRRINRLFVAAPMPAATPENYRAAGRYLQAAARRLLRQCERRGASIISKPPSLGLVTRLTLLLHARWLG